MSYQINSEADGTDNITRCPYCNKVNPGFRMVANPGHHNTAVLMFSVECCKRIVNLQYVVLPEEKKADAGPNA